MNYNFDVIDEKISEKLDGTGTVTDYNEAIATTETGKVPDCTIIRRLYQNFLAGCRAIAQAITGGRDGQGTGGVTTADTASPTTMATNIQTMALKNYNDGLNAATGTTPSVSHVWSPSNPSAGATAALQAKVTAEGYVGVGSVLASTSAGTNSTAIATTAGDGEETINIPPGVYNKIKVNRSAAFAAGAESSKVGTATADDVLDGKTFTNASSVGAPGGMPNRGAVSYTFTPGITEQTYSVKKGYHDGNGVIKCAKVDAKKVLTASQTGTNIDMGGAYRYVNASAVYNAGVSQGIIDAKATPPTFSYAFSSTTAGAAANLIFTTTTSGAGFLAAGKTVDSLKVAAGTNDTAIATGAARNAAEIVKVKPGVYNNVKINNTATFDAGVASVKVARKLTLTASQKGSNVDIADNWYTTCDASAVYQAGIDYADGRVNTNSASYQSANVTTSEVVLNVSGTHYSGNAQSQRPGTEKVRDDYTFTKAYKYVVVLRDSALSQNGRVSISNATLLRQHRNSTPSGGFADCGVTIYKDVKVGSVMVCQSDDWNYNVDTQKWWMNWSVSVHGMN